MNALEAAKVAEAALEDKLGEDIKVLDLRGLSNIADCFVIASGKNANQLHAMANEVEQKLFQQGCTTARATAAALGFCWILAIFWCICLTERKESFTGLTMYGETQRRSDSL